MSEKAETRAAQSAKDSRATTAKVSNLESRVAFLEQDAPEPMPVLPKQAERVEQQDVIIPQSWQVRAFDISKPDNNYYAADFQIYNPVLFFGGVPKKIDGFGAGWTKLDVKTPLSESKDVVARVTYAVDADYKRSFEKAEIVIKDVNEQTPAAPQGKAIEDIQIATLHSSGWDAITQHQAGPIYLGGGGGGVAQKDYSVYVTKVPAAESKSNEDEYWLAQGRVLCSWCVEKKDENGCSVTETCSVEVPEFYILRLDASFMDMGLHQGSRTFCGCTKLYCSLYKKKMCWDDGCSDIENYAKQYCVIPKEMLPYGCIEETDKNYCVLMTAFETCWAQGLCVNHPEDDTQQGCLSGYAACGTFFGITPPYVPEEPEVYFYTEISDVNIDNSTYQHYEA
jgi:hypothetical protein